MRRPAWLEVAAVAALLIAYYWWTERWPQGWGWGAMAAGVLLAWVTLSVVAKRPR